MMKIAAVAAIVALTTIGPAAASGDGIEQQEVSKQQYRTLTAQCRYADTQALRQKCRQAVKDNYRIGRRNRSLDCRTYSGVTVCGELLLSKTERACIDESTRQGLAYRRAEVECYVA
ncbi:MULTISPECIES: hypothetical protein [unclassified Nonomuraea]|uniref:hypothetical protein n=1 Tax=unclassified Nonomuraea TaxID=2593643 RepID=UPI0033C8539D